jgi:hypothetical protein
VKKVLLAKKVLLVKELGIESRNRSFLLLGSLSLFGGFLGLSRNRSSLFCYLDGGEQSLAAVALDSLDRAVLDASPQQNSGDRANDFVLLDESGGGDVFAEFGDAGEEAVVGGLVHEDGVIGFLFGFSLGPFLEIEGVVL